MSMLANGLPLVGWHGWFKPADARLKKMRWRLLRQYVSDDELQSEFGFRPPWLWTPLDPQPPEIDRAIKLLLADRIGRRCETVLLLPAGPNGMTDQSRIEGERQGMNGPSNRASICLSSQPGCGVGCPFCATGALGYRGNFSTWEILEQVVLAGRLAKNLDRALKNVVFMGMGEPLHNASAVFESLEWLCSDAGFGFSPRRITVSTAGVPRAMLDLARRFPRIRLALSLHSVEPALRKMLAPKATCDLRLLRQTIIQLNRLQSQPVWLEVVLLERLNDSLEHARALVEYCRDLRVEVNLIPYNQAASADRFRASSRERREAFAHVLRKAGVRASLRSSLGAENQAACGQLAAHTPSL